MDSAETYANVKDHYAEIARCTAVADHAEDYQEKVATAFGYKLEDLRSLPRNANLGVGCGNPLATANVEKGETVIDLGCGGGIDVLLAASKVGLGGKAVGVDMTKDMLDLARRNAEKAGLSNVSFIEASITSIPLDSSVADCIISNCVGNLVPELDKPLVFREMFRLLKPGGRIAISDILAKKAFPSEVKENISLYVGCVAGASEVRDYERYLKDAGFEGVLIFNTNSDLNVYKEMLQAEQPKYNGSPSRPQSQNSSCSCCNAGSCCSLQKGEFQGRAESILKLNFNNWAGSFRVYAIKPKFEIEPAIAPSKE
ncbi:S-adenosyl-L-methionine-dependent methyltransferase [Lipomyces tetrasporus]|uniref:Arsenite methyltransferase n=1 Tax=Lipomyces tetrasporus TaxID=54092 RepID=A0AAD7QVQ6_9ASCO|nr:S-adenosyl-L-methionine-dependent methyltransferase [Lipomyces tetrasporus]KAJ8102365.1 S-adenosyl-L-methionine-dependent methyltransferase [Lipomyces tetrasporus]